MLEIWLIIILISENIITLRGQGRYAIGEYTEYNKKYFSYDSGASEIALGVSCCLSLGNETLKQWFKLVPGHVKAKASTDEQFYEVF